VQVFFVCISGPLGVPGNTASYARRALTSAKIMLQRTQVCSLRWSSCDCPGSWASTLVLGMLSPLLCWLSTSA